MPEIRPFRSGTPGVTAVLLAAGSGQRMGTRTAKQFLPLMGREVWQYRVGGTASFYASMTAGDGKLYCMNRKGQVTVLLASDESRVLSKAGMGGDSCDASVAIAHGHLFIRTSGKDANKLYCIGK